MGSGNGSGGASIASIGLTAFSAFEKGQGDEAAADYKAARLEQAARFGKVQAAQTDAQLSEQLNTTLGNIDAVRAAANIDPTSPTSAAIRDKQEFVSDRARTTSVNNILRQSAQNEADANYTRQAGDFAAKMDYLGGALDISKSLASSG